MWTSIRLTTEVKNRLQTVAVEEFGGCSVESLLHHLLDEHEQLRAILVMDQFRAEHPADWAAYLAAAEPGRQPS